MLSPFKPYQHSCYRHSRYRHLDPAPQVQFPRELKRVVVTQMKTIYFKYIFWNRGKSAIEENVLIFGFGSKIFGKGTNLMIFYSRYANFFSKVNVVNLYKWIFFISVKKIYSMKISWVQKNSLCLCLFKVRKVILRTKL